MSNLVIIPTYNEKENIERMVRKVFTLPVAFDLLIVDDGSPDGTAQIVKNLQNEFGKKLHLLEKVVRTFNTKKGIHPKPKNAQEEEERKKRLRAYQKEYYKRNKDMVDLKNQYRYLKKKVAKNKQAEESIVEENTKAEEQK